MRLTKLIFDHEENLQNIQKDEPKTAVIFQNATKKEDID